MKKYLSIILTILILVGTGFAIANDLKPYAFPFIGRWQPSEDPVLIDDYGFQDIQNLRKDGKRLRGVSGHTKINTNVIDATYGYPASGFHFKKDNPSESHVLVQSYNSGGTASKVYQNTTAIPSTGDFSATVLHTDASNAGTGRFSQAPQGNVLYCNGEEAKIWGGDEIQIASFITSTAAITDSVTNPRDYTSEVRNTLNESGEVAVIGGGGDSDCDLILHCDGADAATSFPNSVTSGTITAATIAFVDSNPDTITDTGTAFVTSGFVVGSITVSGSGAGNDGNYVVDTVVAGTLTLAIGEALTAEALGPSITITMHPVTAVGNAQVDTAQKKFGSASALFDGVGDILSIPDSADWFMSTSKFTIDFWVRFNSIAPAQLPLFQQYLNATNYVYLFHQPIGTLFQFVVVNGGTTTVSLAGAWSPVVNVWYHVALIRGWGGNANDWSICVNGTSVDTTTDADAWPDMAATFEIGEGGATQYLNGWIDEFRVSKGIALWESNFTPPTTSYSAASSLYWLVGSLRPLQGVKYYIGDGNTASAPTLTCQEWNGASWTSLTITDNTSGLASTGTVTWTSTVDSSELKFLEGDLWYWYQFYLDDGDATIYHITADAAWQDVVNLWDGTEIFPVQFQVYDGGVWENYTLEVQIDGGVDYETTQIAAELDDLAAAEYGYIGFIERVTAIKWNMTSHMNSNAATVTIYYWDGEGWVSVGTVTDNTAVGGNTLAKSDYMHWTAPSKGQEFPQNLFGLNLAVTGIVDPLIAQSVAPPPSVSAMFPGRLLEAPKAYYYKIMVSAVLSADVLVDTVKGIPVVDDIKGYKFPGMFKGRSWLFSEKSQDKNKAIHSAFNAPDVWNGSDSGSLYFGGDEELTAYCSIYNVFRTSGFEQMLVTKKNETYRVLGDSPTNWEVQKLSGNVGCVAPLSMAVCEIADITADTQRHVAIWQANHGVVMCDGATIRTISEDIKCYWDPNDSRYIPTAYQDDSVGWYNPNLHVYKLLITSGSKASTHNIELEYSLKYNEWTKIYREDGSGARPLQCGFQVKDTYGNVYTYGLADDGYIYRLENGNVWVSTAIAEYVWTKSFMMDSERPLFRHSTINYFRLLFEKKTTAATEDIDIAHYCDNVATVHGTDDQAVPTDIDMADGYFETQDCLLGPCLYHSFKLTANMSTVADGMELLGIGLYYESQDTIDVD